MAKINVEKTIKSVRGKVNPRYDIEYDAVLEIANKSDGLFWAIADSFAFGYAQGMKAAKAEMRKKVNA